MLKQGQKQCVNIQRTPNETQSFSFSLSKSASKREREKRLFVCLGIHAYGRVDSARGVLSSLPSTMAYTSQLVSFLLSDLRSDPQSSWPSTFTLLFFFNYSCFQALAGRWAPGARLSGRRRNPRRRHRLRLRFRSQLREAHGSVLLK